MPAHIVSYLRAFAEAGGETAPRDEVRVDRGEWLHDELRTNFVDIEIASAAVAGRIRFTRSGFPLHAPDYWNRARTCSERRPGLCTGCTPRRGDHRNAGSTQRRGWALLANSLPSRSAWASLYAQGMAVVRGFSVLSVPSVVKQFQKRRAPQSTRSTQRNPATLRFFGDIRLQEIIPTDSRGRPECASGSWRLRASCLHAWSRGA